MRYNVHLRQGKQIFTAYDQDGAVGVLAFLNDHGLGHHIGVAMFADLLDNYFLSRPDFMITMERVHEGDFEVAVDHIIMLMAEREWNADLMQPVIDVLRTVRPDIEARIAEGESALADRVSTGNSNLDWVPAIDQRVQTHPATDHWMRGDRFGKITAVTSSVVVVRMDRSRRKLRFARPIVDDIMPLPGEDPLEFVRLHTTGPAEGYGKRCCYGSCGGKTVPEYVRAFEAPGALRAGFHDYRATFPDDLDADDASAAAGEKLTMPVLALWGTTGLTGTLPVVDIWREYATDVGGEAIGECGHFLPEEQPAVVADRLLRFLAPA